MDFSPLELYRKVVRGTVWLEVCIDFYAIFVVKECPFAIARSSGGPLVDVKPPRTDYSCVVRQYPAIMKRLTTRTLTPDSKPPLGACSSYTRHRLSNLVGNVRIFVIRDFFFIARMDVKDPESQPAIVTYCAMIDNLQCPDEF